MNDSKKVSEAGRYALSDAAYIAFIHEFEKLSGIRLDLYKEKQMRRRINTLITRKGIEGYEALIELLKYDLTELMAFKDYITINVTEFFRTPEHWDCFEKEVLQVLSKQEHDCLKIWSCACSTGEEPYSIAMSLYKITELSRFSILATDLDEKVLKAAKEGIYSEKSIENLPQELIEHFFKSTNSGKQIVDDLRKYVRFSKLDLLKDEYPQQCDLVVCRNVLIYFTEEAKNTIYGKIRDCLKPGGYLFTGNTEQIIYYKNYGMKKIANYLYQKI